MPNWAYTKMNVAGPTNELIRFVASCVDEHGRPSLNHMYPIPHGVRDTYNWCITNWGSKWGARDVELTLTAETCEIRFQAAWAPPVLLIEHLSKLFPNLVFGMYHTEEMWHFYGYEVIKNGIVLSFYEKSFSEFPEFDLGTEDGIDKYHEWTDSVIKHLKESVDSEISFHLTEKESA
jgi:hypothetical protein